MVTTKARINVLGNLLCLSETLLVTLEDFLMVLGVTFVLLALNQFRFQVIDEQGKCQTFRQRYLCFQAVTAKDPTSLVV
jgi:hypothetical protein